MDIIQYGVGDKVVTKKAHACGEKVWIVSHTRATDGFYKRFFDNTVFNV